MKRRTEVIHQSATQHTKPKLGSVGMQCTKKNVQWQLNAKLGTMYLQHAQSLGLCAPNQISYSAGSRYNSKLKKARVVPLIWCRDHRIPL